MSTGSEIVGVLKAGDSVQVGFSMTGEGGSWCGVARIDPPGNLGYVPCSDLARQPRRQNAAPAGTRAAKTRGECSQIVEQAFQVAGVREGIAALSAELQSGLEAQVPKGISRKAWRGMLEAVRAAFSPEKLGYRIEQEFVDSCDSAMLEQVIGGLTTPLGAKMVGMEVFAASPEGRRQLSEYANALAQHPPAKERLILMQRMDDSSGASAFTADILMAFMQGITAADGGLTEQDSREVTHSSQSIRKTSLTSSLFEYRGASDQEIAQYIELNETPVFKKFNASLKKAFLDSVGEQSREAGLEITKLFEPR
jgi:hypothetical protein